MIQTKASVKKSSKKYSKRIDSNKKVNKDESSFLKRFRKIEEEEARKEMEKEKLAIAEEKEYERKCKIIYKYMVKLKKELEEKNMTHFWVFLDEPGFKRIVSPFKTMKDYIKKNADKFKNKRIAYFASLLRTDEHGEKMLFGPADIWIGISLNIYHIDNDGNIMGKNNSCGCVFNWLTDDFKITKFSFKLLERIMYIVNTKLVTCPSLGGYALSSVINMIRNQYQLKKRNIGVDDLLVPLKGV